MSIQPSADQQPIDIAQGEPRLVTAIYADGVIRPSEPLDLPDGTPIHLVVPGGVTIVARTVVADQSKPVSQGGRQSWRPSFVADFPHWLDQPLAARNILAILSRRELLLLVAGLIFYSLTRLIGLVSFPIYFFCDEAVQTVLARQLLDNGLRDANGIFLPPYFPNAEKWSLSLSVYVQLLSTSLFGQSVFVNRATSVAVGILGAAAITLTLRLVFNNRFWWAGPLALSAVPTWFLHSRTSFETVMMVSFYACFLCCYLLYRSRGASWLYPALVFGAMTFYSYANGQGVMLVSGVLLFIVDLPYHLRQGSRLWVGAAGLLLILVVPLLRFRLLMPEAVNQHLQVLDSYWLRPLPLSQKLAMFGQNYLLGISPTYWFMPNTVDLERHRMFGMGHVPLYFLPFFLIGVAVSLVQLRSPAHRTMLIAVLAAPFSSAMVGIGVTRVLAMVVPAVLLTLIGFERCYSWLSRWLSYRLVAGATAVVLILSSTLMLRTALVDGPIWYSDYSLSGMQYGARQLFGEAIPELLAENPERELLVSPTWANNPGSFVEFFLNPAQRARVQLINVDAFTVSRHTLDPARQLFIMPDYEYERAQQSGKFVVDPPERIIPYPDGRPGFYIVRMRYVDNVDAIFAADREARAQLVTSPARIDDQPLTVNHSMLDMGMIDNIFDGDTDTLMRGLEANPLVIELNFPAPRVVSGVTLTIGSMDLELHLVATPADGGANIEARQSFTGLQPDPTVQLDLPGAQALSRLRIEIRQTNAGEVTHIHVRELKLR